MTIGRRLGLGFTLIAAMAAVLTAYSLLLSRQVEELRWSELPMEQHMHTVEESLWEAVNAVSSSTLQPDPRYRLIFEEQVERLEKGFEDYGALIDTDAERRDAAAYLEGWEQTKVIGREILTLVEEKKRVEDRFFSAVDQADDVIDFEIQAKFAPDDPQLLRKEQLIREVEVSVWEAIHASQQYTSLGGHIKRAGHAQRTFAELMEKQFDDVVEFWEPYRELAQTPGEQHAIAQFDAVWDDAIKQGRLVVALHDEINDDVDQINELAEAGDDLADTGILQSINQRIIARDEFAQRGKLLALALGITAISSAVLVGVRVTRSVCVPIDRLRHATEEVARGNFASRINSEQRDEVGDVSRAFDHMTAELGSSTEKLQAEVDERTLAERSLRNANETLSRTAAQLTQVNTELKDFVYIASHDLREPLRKISSFGTLLSESLHERLEGDDLENLEFMIDGANRMTEMVEGLLTYSRLNTHEAARKTVDLNVTVAELQHLELGAMLEESSGVIEVPAALPAVLGAPSEIRQLLQNLISNAIKYRRDGTPPHVAVVAQSSDGGMVRIAVADNGIGIPDEHRASVFKMFRRLHARTKYAGTGIGLALCRKVVDKHGGSIGIESNDAGGATVWFTLPAADAAAQHPARAA